MSRSIEDEEALKKKNKLGNKDKRSNTSFNLIQLILGGYFSVKYSNLFMMKNVSLYFAILLKFKKCYQFSYDFEAFEARF